jgi:hypothetical protein
VRVTLNDIVRVKLTDYGRKVMRENHEDLKASAYHAPEEDENGYSKWQLWCLMEEFGAHMRWGGELPFELEIDVKTEAAVPGSLSDPMTFFAPNDISIKEAIERVLAHAETTKAPVTLHYKGWWTGINPTDKATTIFDRYCTRHVTPYDVSDYEPAKGASIVEAANGAIREATSKGPVRLIFNDWKRIVRHYDGLSTLLHEWQQFQAGKETRHG